MASVVGAVVGGVLTKSASDKQASATRDAAAMGAAAADPFADQRAFYQSILRNVYGGMAPSQPAAAAAQSNASSGERIINPEWEQYFRYRSEPLLSSKTPGAPPKYIIKQQEAPTAPGTTGGVRSVPGTATEGGAVTPFGGLMDFITSSPDYQFRFSQGMQALERSAAARGMLNSGNALIDLVGYGQGLAAESYNAEINRIMTMSGATSGSPGTAGQIISSGSSAAAATQAQGQNTMMGQIGYGLANAYNAWNTSQPGMIAQQTGYTGGAGGVLSGAEFASW